MTKLHEHRLGVADGSAPLKVLVPRFFVSAVEQNTPFWHSQNTLSVVLQPNCDFVAGSRFTLSGLHGSVSSSGPIFLGGFVNDNPSQWFQSPSIWSQTGVLTLVTTEVTLRNSVYAFQFNLTNPPFPQPSPEINISGTLNVNGPLNAEVMSKCMEKPHLELMGVANGSDPLLVIEPIFEMFHVQQSSPLWYVVNTITVSMKANCDLLSGTTITISGLTGSTTDDSVLRVLASSVDLDETGAWQRVPGSLTLLSMGTRQRESYVYRFNLTNPPKSQPAPNVSVSATIHAGSLDVPVSVRRGEVRRDDLLSVVMGTEPLFVIEPNFTSYAVGRSTPFPLASNLISVTLQANCDIASYSYITISGLTGAAHPTSSTIAFASEPPNIFVEASASWDIGAGEVVFHVAPTPTGGILANTTVVVTFELQNGPIVDRAPSISVAAMIEAGLLDAPVLSKPMIILPICDAGMYLSSEGVCVICPGNASSSWGSLNVTNCICDIGFEGLDGSACSACKPGTYKNVNGSDACLRCPDGFYSPFSAGSACLRCAGGMFAVSIGARAAVGDCGCLVGYAPETEGSVCTACTPGLFKATNETVACGSCPAGSYSSQVAAAACDSCPANSDSQPASSALDDCVCNAGFVSAGLEGACVLSGALDEECFSSTVQLDAECGASALRVRGCAPTGTDTGPHLLSVGPGQVPLSTTASTCSGFFFTLCDSFGGVAGGTLDCGFYCDFMSASVNESIASGCTSDAQCLVFDNNLDFRPRAGSVCLSQARYSIFTR
eukprot:295708-Rhodomonas_salina.1